MTMPATWEELSALASSAAPLPCSVSLVRRYGLPTGIGPDDRLRISVESEELSLQVFLNGQLLENQVPGQALHSYDVTGFLAPRNELEVRLEIPKLVTSAEACPIRDVRLEITLRSAG